MKETELERYSELARFAHAAADRMSPTMGQHAMRQIAEGYDRMDMLERRKAQRADEMR